MSEDYGKSHVYQYVTNFSKLLVKLVKLSLRWLFTFILVNYEHIS